MFQLSFPECVERLRVGPQFGPDLRHVVVSARRKRAGRTRVGACERRFAAQLLTQPRHLALDQSQTRLKVVVLTLWRHGAILARHNGRMADAEELPAEELTAVPEAVFSNPESDDPRAKWRDMPGRVPPEQWITEKANSEVPGSVQAAEEQWQQREAWREIRWGY